MHEYSIAQQIADVTYRAARKEKAKGIERVVVVIGELALLNEEQVRFWVEEIFSQRDISREAELEVINRPAVVRCQNCDFAGAPPTPGPEAHFLLPALVCPNCGRPGLIVEEGRECLVQRITLTR